MSSSDVLALTQKIQPGTNVFRIVAYWVHTIGKHAIDIILAVLAHKVIRRRSVDGFLVLPDVDLSIPLAYFDIKNTKYTLDWLSLTWGLIHTVNPLCSGMGFLVAQKDFLTQSPRTHTSMEQNIITLGTMATNYITMSRYATCAMSCAYSIAQQIVSTGYMQLLSFLHNKDTITECIQTCIGTTWHVRVDSIFATHLKRAIQATHIYTCTTNNCSHADNDFVLDKKIGFVLSLRDRILLVFIFLNRLYEYNYLSLDKATQLSMGIPPQLSTTLQKKYPMLFTQ